MRKYVFKRLIIAVLTVFVILLILFLMLNFMPGSPFNSEKMSESQIEALYQKYNLDKPIYIRFVTYVKNMLKGDFGISYNIQKNYSVSKMIGERFPISIQIGLQAAILGIIVGMVLGVIAALKKNTIYDTITTIISVFGISLPAFVFALMLSYFIGYKWQLLPMLYSSKQAFRSTILPTIAMSMFTIASVARYARSELIDVMISDYILLADSKGITRVQLIARHGMRNMLIGIITVLAPLVVNLLTGSLVIEKAFSIPGLGSLYIKAIENNDYNVILAISFIYSVMFIVVMLLVDICYGIIDPRIRLAKESKV